MPLTPLVRSHHCYYVLSVDVHVATDASVQVLGSNTVSAQYCLSHWNGWRDHGGSFPHHLEVLTHGRSTRGGWIQHRDWVVVLRHHCCYLLRIGYKRCHMQNAMESFLHHLEHRMPQGRHERGY